MDKHAVAIVLDEISTLLEIHGDNKFKARAFANAARAIEKVEGNLTAMARSGEIEQVPGVGPATAAVIRELVNTGTSRYYLDLRERTPDGLLELLSVPQLGATRIRLLFEQLGIDSLEALERAAREHRIAPVKGFGEKTEARILEGIAYVRSISGRRRYSDAIELGQRLRGFATSLPGVQRAELGGELRRGCETVNALEVVAAAEPAHAAHALAEFLDLPGIQRSEKIGANVAVAHASDGVQLRVTVVRDDSFAAALVLNTGSPQHLERLRRRAHERGIVLDEN